MPTRVPKEYRLKPTRPARHLAAAYGSSFVWKIEGAIHGTCTPRLLLLAPPFPTYLAQREEGWLDRPVGTAGGGEQPSHSELYMAVFLRFCVKE